MLLVCLRPGKDARICPSDCRLGLTDNSGVQAGFALCYLRKHFRGGNQSGRIEVFKHPVMHDACQIYS